jgi:beta-glucosidase/6-phospho-beta-glucosidase/beta-galactosidase
VQRLFRLNSPNGADFLAPKRAVEVMYRNGLRIYVSASGSTHINVNDDYRIAYLESHLTQCMQAVIDGVDLIGYCSWSFTDLLSWLNGYQKRYGFVYGNRHETDQKDLRRIKKASFYWYQHVIRTNGSSLTLEPESWRKKG